MRARIVEVEAYTDDLASHARNARRTPRNGPMFEDAGHAYVYFTYGMHHCFNVVTDRLCKPGAVLIRGLDGIQNANGPARLCKALDIDRRFDRHDLTARRELWLEPGRRRPPEAVIRAPRIGIREARDLPWRYYLAGSTGVSRRDRTAEARTSAAHTSPQSQDS